MYPLVEVKGKIAPVSGFEPGAPLTPTISTRVGIGVVNSVELRTEAVDFCSKLKDLDPARLGSRVCG